MNQKEASELLKLAKGNSTKRNFKQAVELVVPLKGLDIKKPENQVDFYTSLHFPTGKKPKVCALVGPELLEQAKAECDMAISVDEFPKYSEKKAAKKLANEYDYFIAQGNIMPKVATAFGKFFGPKSKMPDPKAGCVVPPNANLKQVVERLEKMVRIKAKTALQTQLKVGTEDMEEKEVIDNILTAYNQLVHHLPGEQNNIKTVIIKLTMGKPAKLEDLGGKKTAEPAKAPEPQEPAGEEQ